MIDCLWLLRVFGEGCRGCPLGGGGGRCRGRAEHLLKITGKNYLPRGRVLCHYSFHSLSCLCQTLGFDFNTRIEKIMLECKIPVWGSGLKHTDSGDV